jgi:lipoprotein NlpD
MKFPFRLKSAIGMACALVVSAGLLTGCASHKTKLDEMQKPPTVATPSSVLAGFYRVNPGDTLATVAASFGRDAGSLARWNNLAANADPIPGQVLRVAPPEESLASKQKSGAAASIAACKASDLSWPVQGRLVGAYGERSASHIVIGGKAGESIWAARAGRVVYAGTMKGYGRLVILKHDAQLLSAYGYNERVVAKEGQSVKRGQTIAQMGSTPKGEPGLLFEVRKDRKAVDPIPYLKTCQS